MILTCDWWFSFPSQFLPLEVAVLQFHLYPFSTFLQCVLSFEISHCQQCHLLHCQHLHHFHLPPLLIEHEKKIPQLFLLFNYIVFNTETSSYKDNSLPQQPKKLTSKNPQLLKLLQRIISTMSLYHLKNRNSQTLIP